MVWCVLKLSAVRGLATANEWERTDRHGVDLAVNSHNRARLLACGKPCYAPWATDYAIDANRASAATVVDEPKPKLDSVYAG